MIKHKMYLWSSFIFLSIEQLIWILDGSFFRFYFYLKVEVLSQAFDNVFLSLDARALVTDPGNLWKLLLQAY